MEAGCSVLRGTSIRLESHPHVRWLQPTCDTTSCAAGIQALPVERVDCTARCILSRRSSLRGGAAQQLGAWGSSPVRAVQSCRFVVHPLASIASLGHRTSPVGSRLPHRRACGSSDAPPTSKLPVPCGCRAPRCTRLPLFAPSASSRRVWAAPPAIACQAAAPTCRCRVLGSNPSKPAARRRRCSAAAARPPTPPLRLILHVHLCPARQVSHLAAQCCATYVEAAARRRLAPARTLRHCLLSWRSRFQRPACSHLQAAASCRMEALRSGGRCCCATCALVWLQGLASSAL